MRFVVPVAFALILAAEAMAQAAPTAEFQASELVRREGLTVVHLWAPWCSNCQTELKSGGWTKMVKDNANVRFVFVSVWNGGDVGAAMLKKYEIADQPNVTIVADPGPRSGSERMKRFLDLPVTWIPTTWVYKTGELRYALNYGEVRFAVLQQFLEDSNSEWSHKGETAQNSAPIAVP
jgi:thiol-disulfide isomerase/thioredoxin